MAHKIDAAMKKGRRTITVMLDLKSAFDRVERSYLINLLAVAADKQTGGASLEDTSVIRWIDNFLTGRSFRTKIDDIESDPHELKVGVP